MNSHVRLLATVPDPDAERDCVRRRAVNHVRSIATFPERGTAVSTVRVSGDLRAPVGLALRQALEERIRRGEPRALLDLSELNDIDAAGVGELVRAFTAMRAAGGVLLVARPNGYVRHLLQIAGLLTLLTGGDEA